MSQDENPSRKENGAIPEAAPRSMDTVLEQWARERSDLDLSAMGAIGDILQHAEMLRRGVLAVWAEAGLDFAALDVLLTLRRQGRGNALTPSALATEMMLSTSAMTNRIDRLEKRGLVRRESDPADRRSVRVQLTEDGFQLAEDMLPAHTARQQEMLRDLSEKERAQLRKLLAKIRPAT